MKPPPAFAVCVYCGSRSGHDPRHADAAARLGRAIGESGSRLVYGGGRAGLMGILADAALESGADVLGVIPRRLMARELGRPRVQALQVVDTMHDRKLAMARAAHAFIALPGGLGTLEELFETWTWRQLGYHDRPIGLLDVAGYWGPLRSMVAHAAEQGFVDAHELDHLVVDTDPARLLARLRDAAPADTAESDWTPI